jgi:hypothetical protein
MLNFSIGYQITKELNEFRTAKLKLASVNEDGSVRYLGKDPAGYYFNQQETLNIIDLYWNSKFQSGLKDANGNRKIFMNIGKFRSEVAAKQIDLDVKDFRFVPDDYAEPWDAIFLQKDFKEWTKDNYFGELINQCVENFPKYGTIILKKVNKKLEFVPLQLLVNEQAADSLKDAAYVIEQHPGMYLHEIQAMKDWNTDGLKLKYGETIDVQERYGYVPLKWLKEINGGAVQEGDEDISVDALVICAQAKDAKKAKEGWHIFFAEEIKKRPYEEVHWNKQHGRWLGCGTMEDLIENQEAKNIIVNLIRRSLQWGSKRIGQTANADVAAKNLATDVKDGTILEVGQNGAITPVDLSSRNQAEFQQFLTEWETNSDQKAFTYEVATGEGMSAGTPYRLGVILSSAVQTYFNLKKQKLGLFFKRVMTEFMIPDFFRDMAKLDRVVSFFSDEAGFEILKCAAINFVKSEATRISLLSGKVVDAQTLADAVNPFEAVKQLVFNVSKDKYEKEKWKFDLEIVNETVDVTGKIATLSSLYQLMAQAGDPRAESVLERIAQLSGENMARFGAKQPTAPAQMPQAGQMPEVNLNQKNEKTNAGTPI